MHKHEFAKYLDAHGWARLLAYLWTRPKFADEFEADPVHAILRAQKDKPYAIDIDYVFEVDNSQRRTRLLKVPTNPGYSMDELNDAIFGLAPVVPMTSWAVHGVAPQL